MKTIITSILLICFSLICAAQESIKVSEDITVRKLSDKVYLYVSVAEIEGWGKIPSNGVIVADNGEAVLLDSPVNDTQTEALVEWIGRELHARVISFVPNHWHDDCIGGLGYLHRQGVKSYASQMTIDLAREHGKPVPQTGFNDSLSINAGSTRIDCYYLGGGHSTDNIAVWIPSEQILFGGCMVKDCHAQGLGNTEDSDLEAWPHTIDQLLMNFPSARCVIPGHGQYGGTELLEHTRSLFK